MALLWDVLLLLPPASKVCAVPHRRRLSTNSTSDHLLVIGKSGAPQQPPRASATGSLGPIPYHGQGRPRDRSQGRQSVHPLERSRPSHLRFDLQPPETNIAAAAVPVSRVGTVQPKQVRLIFLPMKTNKLLSFCFYQAVREKPLASFASPFFQAQSVDDAFSPDRLRDKSTSRGARPRPQAQTWRAAPDHSGEQWADRIIPLQCTSRPREAQLTV